MRPTSSPGKALRTLYKARPYERRRKPLTVKYRAVRVWLAGASLRKTAQALAADCRFSHEAVRQWARRLVPLLRARPKRHRRIVIDETSIFLRSGKEVFGWAALDGDSKEPILTWVTDGRSGLDALIFVKNVLRRVTGKGFFMVDRGVWYPWALRTLDQEWKVQKGGPRNHVECFFGSFKWRLRSMRRRPGSWHTMQSIQHILAAHAHHWAQSR